MIVFNWIMALGTVPGLLEIYGAASFTQLAIPAIFGLLWGIGAVGFGLGIAATGFALGYAVVMGLVLGMGAFVPMLVLHTGELGTPKGLLTLAGLGVMLGGIAISGRAGILKEHEQGERAGQITRTTQLSLRTGLVICVIGGIFSALPNIGLALSQGLIDRAVDLGAPAHWAGNVVWAILFTFGGLVNIVYCSIVLVRRGTGRVFTQGRFLPNLMLLALMSAMWIGSFILYGVGSLRMGSWGSVVGWSVFIALAIAIGNLWGFAQGEWKGASQRSRKMMFGGLAILTVAIGIFAVSQIV